MCLVCFIDLLSFLMLSFTYQIALYAYCYQPDSRSLLFEECSAFKNNLGRLTRAARRKGEVVRRKAAQHQGCLKPDTKIQKVNIQLRFIVIISYEEKIMKRSIAVALTLALVLSLCAGMSVFATQAELTPTGLEKRFYANGIPITVSAAAPSPGVEVDLGVDFKAKGDSAYISWAENGETKYVGVANTCTVHGGGYIGTSFASSSVTMTGGTVSHLFGGGRSTVQAQRAVVTTAVVDFSGGTLSGTVYGGGAGFASVGSATVNISGDAHSMFATGGGAAAALKSTDADFAFSNSFANVDDINITGSTAINVSGGEVVYFYSGGQGYALVESTTVTVTSGNIGILNCGGSNGKTENSTLNLQGGTVGIIQGVERGIVENCTMNISGGTVEGRGIFLGNGGDTDNTGTVTESANLNITGGSITGSVYLGRGLNGAHADTTIDSTPADASGSVTPCAQINIKSPVTVKAANFNPNSTENDNLTLGAGTVLTLKNTSEAAGTTLEIPTGKSLTNLGTIIIESKSTLSIPESAELMNNIEASGVPVATFSLAASPAASTATAAAGVIESSGTLNVAGTLTNKGVVKVLNTGSLATSGDITNEGILENGGALTIVNSGALTNEGTLENGGSITNSGKIAGTKPICATDTGTLTSTTPVTERKVLEGAGVSRTKGAARDMVIKANDSETDSHFFDTDEKTPLGGCDILLDGNVSLIDEPDKCSVSKGSVVVALKKDYLDTLANGTHTVKIVYADGTYTQTTFSLTSPSSPAPSSNSSSVSSTASHPNPSTDFTVWDWLAGLFD